MKILLVEDDDALRMIVQDLLRSAGHDVESASDGADGLARASAGEFDLLVLDAMLPSIDGFTICQRVRGAGYDGAVLMLTARAQVDDRIEGLERGADDYMVKPFDSNELLARVSALLRRVHKKDRLPVERFVFGSVEADFQTGEVLRQGARVSLAAKELQLLRYLIDHRGQVLSRETLLKDVWPRQPFITPRTIDTHIAWLRQKLEDDPQAPRHILTVRGEGYRFER